MTEIHLNPWEKGNIQSNHKEFNTKHGIKNQYNKKYRTILAGISTEKDRLKYLGWRDDLMTRTIIARN